MKCCNHLLPVDMGVACRGGGGYGACVVGKIANDVGTAIHKRIVVLFLPCLVAFLGFHPYMLHFF